jgi:hypothetical protein
LAGGFVIAELWPWLEHSALGAAMRSSPLLYPAVNVAHILGLMLFFAAVALMDARVLGAFAQLPAHIVLRACRPFAIGGFIVQATSGILLFAADAIAVAANPAFRLKMLAVLLGLLNVAMLESTYGKRLRAVSSRSPPWGARVCAGLSLVSWMATATLGRLIAYF